MTLLKIILITVGVAFTTFGYEIYFQKKYYLINGFEEDYKAGRKTERYAKRVGLADRTPSYYTLSDGKAGADNASSLYFMFSKEKSF